MGIFRLLQSQLVIALGCVPAPALVDVLVAAYSRDRSLSAGKQVDYDKFAEAARTVIDLERQINGSQTGYFNRLDEVTNLTAKALADQQNVISIASGRPSVISSTAAEPTYEPIVGAIGALNQATIAQLIAMNQNLGTLIAQGGGGSNSSYGLSTALKLF